MNLSYPHTVRDVKAKHSPPGQLPDDPVPSCVLEKMGFTTLLALQDCFNAAVHSGLESMVQQLNLTSRRDPMFRAANALTFQMTKVHCEESIWYPEARLTHRAVDDLMAAAADAAGGSLHTSGMGESFDVVVHWEAKAQRIWLEIVGDPSEAPDCVFEWLLSVGFGSKGKFYWDWAVYEWEMEQAKRQMLNAPIPLV